MNSTKVSIDIQDVLPKDSEGYSRVQRMRSRVISVKPEICMERAKIVTKVYKETESMPVLPRRAKAFDAVLREMSIFILEDELIVGHQSGKHRSAPLFPEFAVDWVDREIETFPTRAQDKFLVSPEEIKFYREEIVPYWRGKTFHDKMMQYMTEDVRLLRFDAGLFSVGLHEDGGLGHVLLDYKKVLVHGLHGIKEQIEEQRKKLCDSKVSDIEKDEFYRACLSVCDSIIAFAHRYAALARKMAEKETDSKRKAELLQIAANCEKVPEYPAENFYEALQSFWFVQVTPQIYDNGVSISPGRFDQYMMPYYEKDILSGALTKEDAQELLESMWVKFTEPIKVYCEIDAAFHAGFPMGQNLCISGLTPEGEDGTNDLTYRCLEAHSHHLLMQPNFSVRLHKSSPPELLKRSCEVIRRGSGIPQLVNDDTFVNSMLLLGVPLKEARDYVAVGCVEISPNNTWGRCNGGYFNISKIVELTLNNGRCGITGKQVSIKTGDPINFKTFDDFIEAYKKQMNYCVEKLVRWDNLIDKMHAQEMPVPLVSILVDDCIAKGKDVTAGGARYNWTGPLGVGIANAGDSLEVVDRMVFKDKTYTMKELVDALDNNFEGAQVMREYMINKLPKYGNDDVEVDSMVKLATDIFFDAMAGYETYRGGPFTPALMPVASYVAFGMATAALPDGKYKGDPLADGISPNYGVDVSGPTAVMKSVATIDQVRCGNGVIFNQKISPTAVNSEDGLKKWGDLIRTYMDLGGGHVQFNIVSADTLRKAQAEPQKYKGLVVRVAGYSAFFNELAPQVQDSIIARTEHEL